MPPAPPPWVKLTKTDKGAQVQFGPSYNGDVAGYRVYRSVDGGLFQPLPEKTRLTGEDLSFVDEIGSDRMYGYYIVSVDIAGNESAPSETVFTGDPFPLPFEEDEGEPIEPLPGDEGAAPPQAPSAPVAHVRDLGIRLEWTPNAEADQVDEYRIYYAPEANGPYNQIGVSGSAEFEFLSLTTAGWYRVTAANTAGESPPSPAVHFKP